MMQKPVSRSSFKTYLSELYHSIIKNCQWLWKGNRYSDEYASDFFDNVIYAHKSSLYKKLKDVDRWMDDNKLKNLVLAISKLNGLIMLPGQRFSYWRQIGNPTSRRGFVEGMILKDGRLTTGVGGGLCQLSNLLFWMTLHTPLTVEERWRHDYDVFPDNGRVVPFGAGATCSYPNVDLQIVNRTLQKWQIKLWLDDQYLHGQWLSDQSLEGEIRIIEKNHKITPEWWGGYSRSNQLYQQVWKQGRLVEEKLVVSNQAVMMYEPLLNN